MSLDNNWAIVLLESWSLLFLLICGASLKWKDIRSKRMILLQMHIILANAVVLIADIISIELGGRPGNFVKEIILFSNVLVFAGSYFFLYLVMQYVALHLPEKPAKTVRLFSLILPTAGTLLTVLNLYFHFWFYVDEQNVYRRGDLFWGSQLLGLFGAAICLFYITLNLKKVKKRFIRVFYGATVVLGAAAFLQMMGVAYSLENSAMTLCILLMFINSLKEVSDQMVLQEQKISELTSSMVKSQIRPHFLYNCLNSIYYLCDENPDMAKQAIDDFSSYLRTDLDSLNGDRMIPFAKEIEHIERYTRLEKMRFEDRLNVFYDISDKDFMIPSLSVQPIVENAVKHGISKKPEGGNIYIIQSRINGKNIIQVLDDGVGFDYEAFIRGDGPKDERSHIGILNVKRRIEELCHGEVRIESNPEEGTKVIYYLPIEQ